MRAVVPVNRYRITKYGAKAGDNSSPNTVRVDVEFGDPFHNFK